MLVLFDHGTPRPLGRFLVGHTVQTARELGWEKLDNGQLLLEAEDAGFDVLITTDKNLRYQQNLEGRRIAIVVLGNSMWRVLRPRAELVVAAVNAATPGSYTEVEIPG
jgi:hypothetical protein